MSCTAIKSLLSLLPSAVRQQSGKSLVSSAQPFLLRQLSTSTNHTIAPTRQFIGNRLLLSTARSTSLESATSKLFGQVQHLSSSLPSITGAGALAAFINMGLGGWLLVDVAIQWGGWAVSTVLKTEKFYDLLGTGSFAVLAAGSLATAAVKAPRKILVSAMVGVWSLRLGSYLVARVHKVGKDSRFDEVKHQPATFFFYWSMQAMWVFVTLLPVLIINTSPVTRPLTWIDAIGFGVWGTGFAFEAVADAQKDAWRARPENKGKFIKEGLWATSRHPNYFGEMMLWWGMYLTCAGGFTAPIHYASVVSPVMVMLLLRYASGVPILERQGDERWGGQPEYEAYKANTPVLVPNLANLLSSKQKQDA